MTGQANFVVEKGSEVGAALADPVTVEEDVEKGKG